MHNPVMHLGLPQHWICNEELKTSLIFSWNRFLHSSNSPSPLFLICCLLHAAEESLGGVS